MTEARLGGCGPVIVRAGSHLGGDPDVRTGSDPAGRPPWARLGHRQRPRGSFGVPAPFSGVLTECPGPALSSRLRLSVVGARGGGSPTSGLAPRRGIQVGWPAL